MWFRSEGRGKSGGRNDRHHLQGKAPRSRWSISRGSLTGILAAVIVAVGGWFAFGGGNLPGVPAVAKTPVADLSSATFSICGDGRHVNCVVDGDTFWFQGEKIRIADIDTPADAAEWRQLLAGRRLARRRQIRPQAPDRNTFGTLTRQYTCRGTLRQALGRRKAWMVRLRAARGSLPDGRNRPRVRGTWASRAVRRLRLAQVHHSRFITDLNRSMPTDS
jgi:hypothetical protein